MDSVGVNVIETAALGRPFQLGMLYDCRKDNIIAGIRFWNKEQLELNICSRPQINTGFNVTASDSIKDKSNLLNIEGKLNLNVLGGLIQVSGAAKYLKDTKMSFIQQRLTLHYHSTCEFKELTVNQLPPENIPDDVNDIATHIVTGLLYGADACFVFDRQVSSNEDKSTVKGEMKVALEKLMGVLSLDANADLNMNDSEENAVKNFTCTFYGDFQLPSNPTTFKDAMKVFADLPKLLKENQELAVPLRVWLYPLHKLHTRASKLQKEISMDLIQETESVVESLNTAEMKCSDLLEDSPAAAFPAFHDKILQMKQNCYKYKLRLMNKLGSLLPNICGDLMKETALNDLLQEHEESPFSRNDLAEWLKERERESKIIKRLLRRLNVYGAQVEVNIDAILIDLEDGNLVSYTFTSLDYSDLLLFQQTKYLNPLKQGETDEKSFDFKKKSWLSPETQKTMRRNLEIFKNLIESKDCKPAKFIVSSKEMKNHPGSCILLYEHGCDDAVCFSPPSKPVCSVIEEVKGQSVVLKVVPPSCPATVELRLLYKPKQDTVWRSEPVLKDQDTVTLTDLREETEYEIKCAALGKLNYTVYSDVMYLRIIEKKLIMAIDSVINDLSFTENKCSELLKDTGTNTFSAFHKKFEDMMRFCQIYRQDFKDRSQSLIRSVQACEEETCALTNLLQAHQESPFNTQDLMEWITGKEKELNTINEFLQQLLGVGAEVNFSLDAVLSNIKVENVVCYTFSSLEQPDELLSEQENYLKAQTTSRKENPKTAPQTLTWLNGNIREKMREHLIMFKELMIFLSCQSTTFIVSSQDHSNHPGSCILLYEHGCDDAVCFSSPSKPVCPVTEEVKGQSVVLKVVPPSCPATVELRLLYKPKQDTVWRSEPVLKDQDTVTLTDLREETEYEIKCAALGKLNYTRESDVITVKTVRNMRSSVVSKCVKLNLVVCGSDGTLKSSISEQIQQQTDRRSDMELHGRQINLVELPALSRLSEEEVMRQTLRCVSLCHPGVHVFILIIPDAPLNNEDKAEMEEIQRIFSSRINKHIMILIKQNSEHQTAELNEETQSVFESFGGRRHFFGPKTQVSILMENIEQMLEENTGECFSTETFLMKILMDKAREREEEMKKLEEEKEMKMIMEEERQNQDKERKRREEELRVREEQHKREMKERLKDKMMMKICCQADHSIQVTAHRKLETEYSKWTWSLRRAMMETENKLQNKIENEAIHEVEETDIQRELKETSKELDKSVSEFLEKDKDEDILIQWKTSFEIKDLQENIVRETKRKLNVILQQRDLKKKIDAQRTHHENTLYEKSKELALKFKDKTHDEEILKKEFDLFWEQSMKEIIRDTPAIKDIDFMRDVRLILSYNYRSAPVDHWWESRDIFTVPSYNNYVKVKIFKGINAHIRNVIASAKNSLGCILSREDEIQIRSFVSDVVQQTDRMIQSFNISKMGYNISCIQQLIDCIRVRITEHEEESVKYEFKNEFFIDLVVSICTRAITDQHRLFREDNDPVLYLERKREEYYSIFQKYCYGAASAVIFAEIICQKLKEPIEQSVYKKTARDLTDEMRSNCESLNGNRSNLERHILKTLAEEEDFDKYMNYIHNPRDHFKSFIRDEVSRYINDQFKVSVLPKMKENIKLLQQKIMKAVYESTEHVQVNRGDAGLWLKSFTQQLSDELIFSEKDLSGVKHDDVEDFNLLEEVIKKELPSKMFDISWTINRKTFPSKLNYNLRPDELLIDHLCQCCWVQCPFCKAICTNTTENHDGDHSVAFHRVTGINGTSYNSTYKLCTDICTNLLANNLNVNTKNGRCVWKKIKIAGPQSTIWSITSDLSELPYWKWFVCKFQQNLEKYYRKTFEESGEIPDEWREHSKQEAIESLDKYI